VWTGLKATPEGEGGEGGHIGVWLNIVFFLMMQLCSPNGTDTMQAPERFQNDSKPFLKPVLSWTHPYKYRKAQACLNMLQHEYCIQTDTHTIHIKIIHQHFVVKSVPEYKCQRKVTVRFTMPLCTHGKSRLRLVNVREILYWRFFLQKPSVKINVRPKSYENTRHFTGRLAYNHGGT
jgi:hypothetical protein